MDSFSLLIAGMLKKIQAKKANPSDLKPILYFFLLIISMAFY
jgi:hypothetical protein